MFNSFLYQFRNRIEMIIFLSKGVGNYDYEYEFNEGKMIVLNDHQMCAVSC